MSESNPLVSVCIPSYNQAHFLGEAIRSVLNQDYKNIEVIILDDASTDNPRSLGEFTFPQVKYVRSETPSGTGGAFNKAMSHATGDFIVFLCSDDVFTDRRVLSDIVKIFTTSPDIVHVSRYYHQFIDGDRRPIRAWRCNDIIELANNPSGLAFRRSAIRNYQLSNKMFVEASSFVADVIKGGWYSIILWDTVAVRIHQSISQNKDYYLKRWVSSPVEEWSKVGGKALLNDFTSLIQIKNNFKTSAVIKECLIFIKLKPSNLLNPTFLFFALVSVLTPRFILRKLPDIYRRTWGRWTTREVKRP